MPCGALGSLGCAMGVVGIIWVAGFIGVCPGVRRVPPGSLSSLSCAMGVLGSFFVVVVRPECRWVYQGSPGLSAVAGFIGVLYRVRPVYQGSPWESSGSSGAVAGISGVRPEGRRVYPGLLGLLWCTQGVVGFI